MLRQMNKRQALIFVLFLFMVAAAVALYRYVSYEGGYDRSAAAQTRLSFISQPLREYAKRHGRFPEEAGGLSVLVAEGLLNEISTTDPWGRPFSYKCGNPQCSSVTVYSIGDATDDHSSKPISISVDVESSKRDSK
jgi:type II secretory pathway pseudopilin PulG